MRCRRGGHRPDSSSSASFKGVLLLWPLTSCNPGELLGSVVPLSPATLAGRGGVAETPPSLHCECRAPDGHRVDVG